MISRRLLINFLLVVLIIICTYIGIRFDVKTGYQQQPPLIELRPSEITKIELETKSGALLLQSSEKGWSFEKPIQWPADNRKVALLIDIVNSNTESLLAANNVELAALGLDAPDAIMRLNETPIAFGTTNNIGARRYTRVADSVYLLPDLQLPVIQQGLTGLADRRLLPPQFRLQSLSLPDIELTRTSDGRWSSGKQGNFSQPQLTQLVTNWQSLAASAIKIFDHQVTPRHKIRARIEGQQPLEFFLLSIDPEIVIAHPRIGLQFHFRPDLYYQLLSLRADENLG